MLDTPKIIAIPTIKKTITVITLIIVIQYSISPKTLTLIKFSKYNRIKKVTQILNEENCLKNSQ